MRIKRSMVVLVAICAMRFSAAQAEGPTAYFGGGLGQARAPDLPSSTCSQLNGILDPGFSCGVDDSKTAFKLFAGAQFNEYLAAEANVVYLGNFEGTASGTFGGSPVRLNFSYEVSGLTFDAVGTWPITKEFALVGRVGAFLWSVTDIFDEVENGVSLDYGAGVEYDFTRNIGLRAEYVKYQDVCDNASGKSDLGVASLSLIYRIR